MAIFLQAFRNGYIRYIPIVQYRIVKNKGIWRVIPFSTIVQDAELLPYCPVNSPEQICSEIESGIKDINCLIKISDKWLQEARNYKDRYNFNETESICNAVIASLENILDEHHFDDEEVEWYIEEMISDYDGVLKSVRK